MGPEDGRRLRYLSYPRAWLAACAVSTVALGLGLRGLELRTDGAAIYPVGDPAVERTRTDRRAFFEQEQVLVLLTPRHGGVTLDSPAGLRHLKNLHASLAGVPGVRTNRLRSLATLLDPRPDTPLIRAPRFLDKVSDAVHGPDTESGHAALLKRIDASPLARGLFLAPSGRAAAFYVPVARDQSRSRLVADLERWTAEHRTADFELRLTGPVAAEVNLGRTVLRDLARLVPLMAAAVAALLAFCLRNAALVLVAMAEILVVLVCTLGAMGHCGVPVTLVTTILPVLLISVAVTDEVHLLERFQVYLRDGTERRQAVKSALTDVARPIVVTSLTTSIAFLSFLAAAMTPVRHFGLFTALGVLLAMVLSFTFVPACLLVLPASWLGDRKRRPAGSLTSYERWAVRRRNAGAVLAVLLVAVTVPGLFRLSVQDSWADNFDPRADLIAAERVFNAELWGSYRFDVVLTAPEVLFFHRPEGLRLTAELTRVAEAGPHVGGVLSHLIAYGIVADIWQKKEGWEEDVALWELPAERLSRIARLLYRVRQSTDLDQVLVSDGSGARLRIFVKSADYMRARELEDHLERELPALLEGTGVGVHFSGDLPVAQAVVEAVVGNVLRSVGWTLAGVCLLLVLLHRSLRAAAITVAPLLAGILVLLGTLGYAGVPLGIATSLFIAVTLGVGVDFSVHFCHAYRRHHGSGLDHEPALEAAFRSAGRAIRWNAVILGLGLLVLALSGLKPNHSLGLLLAAAMAACYAATLLVLPRLLQSKVGDPRASSPTPLL